MLPSNPMPRTRRTQPRPARQHAHATSGCCRAIPRRGQGAGTGALVLHNTACALSSASLLRCTKQRRAAWAAAEGACMSPRIAKIRKGRGGVSRPPPPLPLLLNPSSFSRPPPPRLSLSPPLSLKLPSAPLSPACYLWSPSSLRAASPGVGGGPASPPSWRGTSRAASTRATATWRGS